MEGGEEEVHQGLEVEEEEEVHHVLEVEEEEEEVHQALEVGMEVAVRYF